MKRKKIVKKEEKKINLGTLYDMNIQLMQNAEPLSEEVLKELLSERIEYFFLDKLDKYFMLLNKELSDYTIFYLGSKRDITTERVTAGFRECLENRGKILSMELTKDNSAVEIWLRIGGDKDQNNVIRAYYLFPCDSCVIE